MRKAHDDSLSVKADAAFRQAVPKVILRAKLAGTPIVVWEDGHIKEVSAEEMESRLGIAASDAHAGRTNPE